MEQFTDIFHAEILQNRAIWPTFFNPRFKKCDIHLETRGLQFTQYLLNLGAIQQDQNVVVKKNTKLERSPCYVLP